MDVDSGADSLAYLFPYLDDDNDYSLLVEFYTECDSSTNLQIQLGTNLDTLEIPGNSFSWYETEIPSSTDTLALVIRRIGTNGFVPVSRVIARRRTSADMYTMGMPGQSLELAEPTPIAFCLFQPYPNPFTNSAMIRYSLPYAARVNLKVYDISGRLVTNMVDGKVKPGVHTAQWTGRDDLNRRCASGVYFVRFVAEDYKASKKMVLIK